MPAMLTGATLTPAALRPAALTRLTLAAGRGSTGTAVPTLRGTSTGNGSGLELVTLLFMSLTPETARTIGGDVIVSVCGGVELMVTVTGFAAVVLRVGGAPELTSGMT